MIEYPYAVEIRAIKKIDGELLTVSQQVNTELIEDSPPDWGKLLLAQFDAIFEKAIAERARLRERVDQLPDVSVTVEGELT